MKLFLALQTLLLWSAAGVAAAADFTPAQRDRLVERIAGFETALAAKDTEGVLATMPPRFFRHIGAQMGADEQVIRDMVAKQTRDVMANVSVYAADLNEAAIEYLTTPGGESYAFVPMRFVMSGGSTGKIQSASKVLALYDEADWWLLRVAGAGQVAMIQQIYPYLTGVQFTSGVTKAVE